MERDPFNETCQSLFVDTCCRSLKRRHDLEPAIAAGLPLRRMRQFKGHCAEEYCWGQIITADANHCFYAGCSFNLTPAFFSASFDSPSATSLRSRAIHSPLILVN